ncbi:hypothetical protein [Nocardioides sambongensis]|uniref:hypothetical protein n=1 Tax=Nocardioides sambongensis TaxID=2589074 RepID=UPI00112E2CDD|nr:hypothetical protein [Nocardioides sambongensis]
MSDHDPLQELSRFGTEFEGGAMPVPAAEIRRRGDRIRRRRRALAAGGAALAVAVVAVPVLALTGDSDKKVAPADPTDPTPVTPADLLSDAETVYSDGADWFTTGTYPGDGQSAFIPCAQESMGALGATSIQQRDFELRPTDIRPGDVNTDPEPTNQLHQAVAEFESPQQAAAAYTTIASWVSECRGQAPDTEDYRIFDPLEVDQPAEGEATILQANYGLGALPELDPYGDSAYITETGLAVSGTRLTVARVQIYGQDYNFLPAQGGTPMQRMLPVASELMLPGGEERSTDTTTSATESGIGEAGDTARPDAVPGDAAAATVTSFPEDFALDQGWGSYDAASYDLTAPGDDGPSLLDGAFDSGCGGAPGPEAPTGRLTTELSGPTQGYAREAQLFPTDEDAQDALEDIVAGFSDCVLDATESMTRYDVVGDVLGDDSRRIIRLTETGDGVPVTESTQVWWVGRTGNALLLMTGTEEGGGTLEAGNALLDGMLADADPAFSALQDLVEGSG